MHTAGSRVASWHLRQDIASGQGSGTGTRVLRVGGVARSSSWTAGFPRDKGALKRASRWYLFGVAGITREDALVFFLRVPSWFLQRGLPGLRHFRGKAVHFPGCRDGRRAHLCLWGRIWPVYSSAQPVVGQGAPVNSLCSKHFPVSPSRRRAQPGNEVCLHLPVQQHGGLQHSGDPVSARRCLPDKPAQAVHSVM